MRLLTVRDILDTAAYELKKIIGKSFGPLALRKPGSITESLHLVKIISKLSPILGNSIEIDIVDYLNSIESFNAGKWIRQDPGFPDALFVLNELSELNPGIEIKAWFPLATEITARFKESQNVLNKGHVDVAIVAWIPEFIFFGDIKILDICVIPGESIAIARDNHYHNPPHYIVLEPENTLDRTKNLQQSNTNGFKLQSTIDTDTVLNEVTELGLYKYSPLDDFQTKLKAFRNKHNYRGDTNYAKIDRIKHEGIEQFKKKVLSSTLHGYSILDWGKKLTSKNTDILHDSIKHLLSLD